MPTRGRATSPPPCRSAAAAARAARSIAGNQGSPPGGRATNRCRPSRVQQHLSTEPGLPQTRPSANSSDLLPPPPAASESPCPQLRHPCPQLGGPPWSGCERALPTMPRPRRRCYSSASCRARASLRAGGTSRSTAPSRASESRGRQQLYPEPNERPRGRTRRTRVPSEPNRATSRCVGCRRRPLQESSSARLIAQPLRSRDSLPHRS
mmetsp:Transcript_79336/g.222743  ORF Transcript_79336/g.222743 Transcript_79336/m.222743 type:complete len:208 (+) Transcript_79336:275-898(+)